AMIEIRDPLYAPIQNLLRAPIHPLESIEMIDEFARRTAQYHLSTLPAIYQGDVASVIAGRTVTSFIVCDGRLVLLKGKTRAPFALATCPFAYHPPPVYARYVMPTGCTINKVHLQRAGINPDDHFGYEIKRGESITLTIRPSAYLDLMLGLCSEHNVPLPIKQHHDYFIHRDRYKIDLDAGCLEGFGEFADLAGRHGT